MTDPLSHHHSPPSPRLFLFAAVIFHLFLSALIIPPLSFTSAKLVFPLPPHLAFPPPPLPLHLPLPFFPVFIPTLFCEQLNVYFMSASSSILPWPLLGGFALLFHILFVPLFAVSIKDGIEISCANARAHTHTYTCARRDITLPHTATNKTTTCCAKAYERAQTSRPTFALPSSHPFASLLTLSATNSFLLLL